MPLEFIYSSSPQNAMGKEKWHKTKFEKSTKSYSIGLEKNNDKMEIKF